MPCNGCDPPSYGYPFLDQLLGPGPFQLELVLPYPRAVAEPVLPVTSFRTVFGLAHFKDSLFAHAILHCRHVDCVALLKPVAALISH